MKILLLGKNGQLGWELQRTMAPLGNVIALDYPEINLSSPDKYTHTVREIHADVIINATAYTAVDRAEEEAEFAMAINGQAPGILAEIAKELGAGFIHYSTDYVFDGTKDSTYTENDTPNPINIYGKSKLAGERAVQDIEGAFIILRTSWVYSLRGDSFVTKVLRWARQHETLKVVDDQISNPTWARMLAEITALLMAQANQQITSYIQDHRGLYHLAGSGFTSRLEWAQAILACDPHPEDQITQQIHPAKTSNFPAPARRPLYSALSCEKFNNTFHLNLPHWQEALSLAMDQSSVNK